jgi:hypothetical protein
MCNHDREIIQDDPMALKGAGTMSANEYFFFQPAFTSCERLEMGRTGSET